METIIALKKDLKHFYFINYIIKNCDYTKIKVILNDIVSDDIGDIIEKDVSEMYWISSKKENLFTNKMIKVDDDLYLSRGLEHFLEVFENETLLLNFNELITVADYKKLKDRMSYV